MQFLVLAVQILMIVVLNDLEVKSANILNAYAQAPMTEKVWTKVWTILGPETAVIKRALNYLKTERAAFRSHLASRMESIGYLSWGADIDLLIKPEIHLDVGVQCYSNFLCYVDNTLCIHHDSDSILQCVQQ